jgi:pyrroloquinoline quinone (PQQ) biosynthesis protein C
MFPSRVSLASAVEFKLDSIFGQLWSEAMTIDCHAHPLWKDSFVQTLSSEVSSEDLCFELASIWAVNMVVGSYCFPRYVAALASRAEQDAVRHGLIENAWDESGAQGHTNRSHFWLAVRLAHLLGLSDSEIELIRPLPEAQIYTDEHYQQCVSGDFGFALGMICLIEEFTTPEFTLIFKSFLKSSKHSLHLDPTDFVLNGGAEYFTANISDDERHRQEMPSLVATWLCANGIDLNDRNEVSRGLEPIRAGAKYSADLRQQFFHGIYDFVNHGGKLRDLISPEASLSIEDAVVQHT